MKTRKSFFLVQECLVVVEAGGNFREMVWMQNLNGFSRLMRGMRWLVGSTVTVPLIEETTCQNPP